MPIFLGQTVSEAEYAALTAHYEEMAFKRKASQGELCAPMVISDTQNAIMSMTNGQHYDSKSEMRKEYKRAGVIEVGNDVQTKRATPSRDEINRVQKERHGSIHRALSRIGVGAV
jgi:ribose 5-phosphate isomerase